MNIRKQFINTESKNTPNIFKFYFALLSGTL